MNSNDIIEKYREGQTIFRRQSVDPLIVEILDLRRQLEITKAENELKREAYDVVLRRMMELDNDGQRTPRCKWQPLDDDFGTWISSCDGMFIFEAGGPPENDFAYCPYCGHPPETDQEQERPEWPRAATPPPHPWRRRVYR